ncbi:hypothetical protein BDU57DRAFT_451017 [Ampelomyces quisqualis]|uniref:BTB domain-containing protein n=1 Tax=Ampelomyces quisqualis TaxID=50730 RepID=A0A6A5QLE8_AMPQU|nr:hypothetical protein BDU57DRAFT_451017 [Ampelomyces quisqualis]
MSTYIGYCISYGLYPDPDDIEVIDLVYSKLPATAMLPRYLVLSTIYFWSPEKLTLESGKLERLHPGFTLDVMTAQAQRGQSPEGGKTEATKTVPHLAKYGLRNSCVFHEHQTISGERCRHRLTHSKFIFDGLLHACVKKAEAIVAMDVPIHRELLASVSPYFHGAFNGDFKEASDGIISLTDVTEQTFRIFLQWAHSRLQPHSPHVRIPGTSILPTEKPFGKAQCTTGNAKTNADGEAAGDEDNHGEHSSTSNADESTLDSDEKACRERMKVAVHVFVELIHACAKDGISMLEE